MLAAQISREQLGPETHVLDLCTGSGLLATVAARAGARRVVAVDASRRAVAAAWLNARLNGVKVRAVRGNLLEPVRGERFDLIVSNPPYLPSFDEALPGRGPVRAWDAGLDGRTLVDEICAQAPAALAPGGKLLLLHSSVCGERVTIDALRAGGLEAEVAFKHQGPLGPILRSRAAMLRQRGLIGDEDAEEILIFRARRP